MLIDAIADGGVVAGLNKDLALTLAAQTMLVSHRGKLIQRRNTALCHII